MVQNVGGLLVSRPCPGRGPHGPASSSLITSSEFSSGARATIAVTAAAAAGQAAVSQSVMGSITGTAGAGGSPVRSG